MIIAIDFDGTCVTHDYPHIGQDIGAVLVLRELVDNGHQLMLWTMRGNKPESKTLDDAVNWFKENGIPLWGINENPEQTETGWTNSKKQYAQLYIDDAALGCPLVHLQANDDSQQSKSLVEKGYPVHERPYVYWPAVKVMLAGMNLIPSTIKTSMSRKSRQG